MLQSFILDGSCFLDKRFFPKQTSIVERLCRVPRVPFVEQAAPRRARHLFTKKLVSFPTENSWVKIARRQFLPHAPTIRPHAIGKAPLPCNNFFQLFQIHILHLHLVFNPILFLADIL